MFANGGHIQKNSTRTLVALGAPRSGYRRLNFQATYCQSTTPARLAAMDSMNHPGGMYARANTTSSLAKYWEEKCPRKLACLGTGHLSVHGTEGAMDLSHYSDNRLSSGFAAK